MPVDPFVATGTACGRHSVASLLSMREGFPQNSPFTSLLFLPVSQNGAQAFFLLRPSSHRGAISESPSAAALFRYGRLSCLRHALRAWIRRLPVVRPATAIASSTGPGYHALPTPGPPAATHGDSPAARRRDRHTQPDKRIGEGGADRMVAARPWPSGTAMLREKERNASKNSFSPLPSRKETP